MITKSEYETEPKCIYMKKALNINVPTLSDSQAQKNPFSKALKSSSMRQSKPFFINLHRSISRHRQEIKNAFHDHVFNFQAQPTPRIREN